MPDMTYREMNLRIFRGQPIPHVLFQPRFEPWYVWHKQFDSMPEQLRGMSLVEVYEDVDCSQRYVDYGTGNPSPVRWVFTEDVKRTVQETPGFRTTIYHTPHGDLTQVQEFTVDRTWRVVEFPAKSNDDLDALEWLVNRRDIGFKPDAFEVGASYIGDRGEPQFFIIKSPYLALAQQYMRFEAFIYAMADDPARMERIMDAIDATYDRFFEELCQSNVRLLNFGENIAEAHMSPAYFERYLQPWYEKRVDQLRAAGIFTHIHIDGFFKHIIPQVRNLPHDALEALTPVPQGDVTLDEIEEALNGKILLDGIPAVLFLEHHPFEELQQCVEELCNRFGPRLVLGISDELPQAASEEGYRRMKWVADYARQRRLNPTHSV